MGQRVPAGQQVHVLPTLSQWAQSHHAAVRPGPGGGMSGGVQAKRPGCSGSGQVSPAAGLWSRARALRCSRAQGRAPAKAPPDSLPSPWVGRCFWALISWLPCSFSPAALREEALESFVYSF